MSTTSPENTRAIAMFSETPYEYLSWGFKKSLGDAKLFKDTILEEHRKMLRDALNRARSLHMWDESTLIRCNILRLLRYIRGLSKAYSEKDEDLWDALENQAEILREKELSILKDLVEFDPIVSVYYVSAEDVEETVQDREPSLPPVQETHLLPIRESEDNTDSDLKKKHRDEIMGHMEVLKVEELSEPVFRDVGFRFTEFEAEDPRYKGVLSHKPYSPEEEEYKGYSPE